MCWWSFCFILLKNKIQIDTQNFQYSLWTQPYIAYEGTDAVGPDVKWWRGLNNPNVASAVTFFFALAYFTFFILSLLNYYC